MEILAPLFLLVAVVFGGGLFWGFLSAGKRLRNEAAKPLTPGGAIGLVVGFLASAFAAYWANAIAIGLLALGALSDSSNTMPQVMPFVIGSGIVGAALVVYSGWLLTYLIRLLHAGHTSAK